VSLGRGTEIGAMGKWDVLRNATNDGYQSRWFANGFAHQHLVGGFGVYAETTLSMSSASASTFVGGLGGGVLFALSKTLQFDYGLSRGLGNRPTDWINVLWVR
jgi:hypothetical protein